MVNFYSKTKDNSEFFSPVNTTATDLREELHKILWTEGRGVTLIYRKVKMDSRGTPSKCVCWDPLTQEPDRDTNCRTCHGLGYIFQDLMVRGYRSQSQGFSNTRRQEDYGLEQTKYRTFYFEHNVLSLLTGNNLDIPTRFDKIIEPEVDIEGNILSPLNQRVKYDIISVDPYRLEKGGRLEYYRVRARANLEGSFLV